MSDIIPNRNDPDFIGFLHWLDEQGMSTSEIIRVVEKPQNYGVEYGDYLVEAYSKHTPTATLAYRGRESA